MNEFSFLIRGYEPREIRRTGWPAVQIAQQLRFCGQQMKQMATRLVLQNVPLRDFLLPYVDTVLLQPQTPAYFFGGRMLISCPAERASALRDTLQSALNAEEFPMLRMQEASDPAALRKLLHARARSAAFYPSTLEVRSAGQLTVYAFPSGRMTEPYANPMRARARARAVLAFGDILGRTVRRAGGEIVCCTEDELDCFWPESEPETLFAVLQQTYANQLAPALGGVPCMKRIVYAAGKPL